MSATTKRDSLIAIFEEARALANTGGPILQTGLTSEQACRLFVMQIIHKNPRGDETIDWPTARTTAIRVAATAIKVADEIETMALLRPKRQDGRLEPVVDVHLSSETAVANAGGMDLVLPIPGAVTAVIGRALSETIEEVVPLSGAHGYLPLLNNLDPLAGICLRMALQIDLQMDDQESEQKEQVH